MGSTVARNVILAVFIVSSSTYYKYKAKVINLNQTGGTSTATEMILLCLIADVDTRDGGLQSRHPSCAHCAVNEAKSKHMCKLILRRAYFESSMSSILHMQKPLATPQISEKVGSSDCMTVSTALDFVCLPFLSLIQCIHRYPSVT